MKRTNLVPNGWMDRADMFFASGDGFAIQRSNSSSKFGKGIVANIRSRYQDIDSDLDDKFEGFKEDYFYLKFQSPRGFSTEALKLREIINRVGERHFSADLAILIKLAEETINQAQA